MARNPASQSCELVFCGCREASLHNQIELPANPGIRGSIGLLRRRKGAFLPVGKLGRFGKSLREKDCGEVAKPCLFNF